MYPTDDAGIPARYLIPPIEIERFEDAALVFLTDSETFITVNLAAADLLELLMAELGHRPFGAANLTALLLDNFELDAAEAQHQADQILKTWSSWGIFQPVDETTSMEPNS